MKSTRLVLIGSVCVLALASACQGKSATPAPADAKQAAATPATKAQTAPQAVESPLPDGEVLDDGDPEGIIANPPPTAPAADPGKDLGAQRVDPRWFRKTLFGDESQVIDTKRSQADDQGRFSSLIRFELPDMTPEACADHLAEAVAKDIPAVERTAEANGRIQLKGSTDRYSITFICGQAEGKTIAYVSYQWT